MHINAKEIANNSIIEGDICIVGAGAAGISIALEYLNTPYKVILLEGGGFEYDEKVQESHSGKNIGHKYFPLQTTRFHKFGGTTALWAGACSTLDDIDFENRDWVENSGWPISKDDLVPYYKRAHSILDLGPYEYELDYWKSKNPKIESLPFNSDMFWNKIWQFSPPTRFDQKYRNEIENSKNITLYTYAKAVNIEGNDSLSKVKSIEIKNYGGKKHIVKAKYFILSCGAIQNARLLMASRNQNPNGVGNEHDNVGRYFMEHIEVSSGELWLSNKMNLSMDLYLDHILTNSRAEIALSAENQLKYGILNGTISFRPLRNYLLSKPKLEKWSNKNPLINTQKRDLSLYDRIKRKLSKINVDKIDHIDMGFKVYSRFEQAPNRNSRIVLDNIINDNLGVPLTNLDWQLSSLEKKSIRKTNELFAMKIGSMDVGRMRLDDYLIDEDDTSTDKLQGGFHHMGTTRMSTDIKKGVVDSDCKIHSVSNLFVGGSSCFSTSGGVNPTLSLVALSIRLSDHIKSLLSKN